MREREKMCVCVYVCVYVCVCVSAVHGLAASPALRRLIQFSRPPHTMSSCAIRPTAGASNETPPLMACRCVCVCVCVCVRVCE